MKKFTENKGTEYKNGSEKCNCLFQSLFQKLILKSMVRGLA